MGVLGERPFVGRAAELAELGRHLAAAEDGAGRVVLVLGEAGVGKTRLVSQATAAASGRVVTGRCHEGGAPAYWPWIDVLRQLVDVTPDDRLADALGAGAAEIARLVPAVRRRMADLAGAQPGPLDAVEARFRLFDAITRFLVAVATEPVVVVLDDLHWADGESLLLLRFLAPEIRRAPILIVATAREAELREAAAAPHLLADLVRLAERIPLAGLSAADVREYARAAAGSEPSPAAVQAVHRASGGNAFFVTELVDLLRRHGALDAPQVAVDGLALPAGVRDAVLRRVEGLDGETRRLLDVAAVAGHDVELAVVARATQADAAAVLGCLAPAIDRGVLTESGAAPGRLRFVHDLVAESLRGALSPDLRCRTHLAIADALESVHADAIDDVAGELSRHLLFAAPLGTLERAVALAMRAGDLEMRRLGYEDAAVHYARALEAAQSTAAAPAMRLDLSLRLAAARLAASDDDGARSAAIAAAQLARDLGDGGVLARAAAMASAARSETGRADPVVIGLLEDAVAAARGRDAAALAVALPALAREVYFVDRERRLATSDEGLALARASGDPVLLAAALGARHLALWEPGTARERLALATEQIAVAEAHEEFQSAMHAHAWRIADLLELGETAAADEAVARYEALAQRRRLPRLLWHVAVARASQALRQGRLEEAERLAQRALGLWQAGPQNNVLQFYAIQLFTIREEQGRLGELDRQLQDFAAASPVPAWQVALASLHASLGRPEPARRIVRELAARSFDDVPFDGTWLATMARLGLTCAAISDRDGAAALLDRVRPYVEYDVVIGAGVVCLGPAARFAGVMAHAAGRLDEARSLLGAAVETSRSRRAMSQLAHAQAELAQVLRELGDDSGARSLAAEAAPLAEALGLGSVRDALARRAGDAAIARGESVRAASSEPAAAASTSPAPAPTAASAPRTPGAAFAAPTRAVLRREGDVWLIAHGGEQTRVRDMKGVAYLAHLLRSPGREFHALDVVGQEPVAGDDAGEMIDAEARRAYKRRLEDLRDELEEAESFNDVGRSERLREEMEAIAGELARATGLRGRERRAGSIAERARLNVTRAIRKAIAHVETDCPLLGHHLSRSVETGRFCCYVEDPTFPILWDVSE